MNSAFGPVPVPRSRSLNAERLRREGRVVRSRGRGPDVPGRSPWLQTSTGTFSCVPDLFGELQPGLRRPVLDSVPRTR